MKRVIQLLKGEGKYLKSEQDLQSSLLYIRSQESEAEYQFAS